MTLPLDKRKRRISFFDLESKFIPGVEYIDDVIVSKLKYVRDITDHLEILNEFRIFSLFQVDRKELGCLTSEDFDFVINYVQSIGNAVIDPINNEMFKVTFEDHSAYDLCLYCSSDKIRFYGLPIITEFSKLDTKNILFKIRNNVYNTDVPINYNKLIIGPLENTTIEELFNVLNEIGEIVSIRNTTDKKYFTFSFLDSDLNKCFVDVLTRYRKQCEDLPEVRYCYQDCIILKFNSMHPCFPIVCSLKKTKIVMLLNANPELNIDNVIRTYCKKVNTFKVLEYNVFDKFNAIKWKSYLRKIFIECEDITSAEIVYYNLGGLNLQGSILITCYYPEYNFSIGEYE